MQLFSVTLFSVVGVLFGASSNASLHRRAVYENNNKLKALTITLMEQLKQELNLENIICINSMETSDEYGACGLEHVLGEFLLPKVIVRIDYEINYEYWRHFSWKAVIVICGRSLETILNAFEAKVLDRLNNLRHIVYLDMDNSDKVAELCWRCFEKDIYNVFVLTKNTHETQSYYSCRRFPPSKVPFDIKQFNQTDINQYKNQFMDMYGSEIVTQPDQIKPRSMVYLDENGVWQMLGYIGKLVRNYAEKHNATLRYALPIKQGESLLFEKFMALTRNNSMDIGATTVTSPSNLNVRDFSYPYDIGDYCFMIPLPLHMPVNRIYFLIVQKSILITIFLLIIIYGILLYYSLNHSFHNLTCLIVLLNDKSIRGMLGQSFPLVMKPSFNTKFVCFQLCYASLMINTMYQAFLQSYFTQPTAQQPPTDAASVEAAGLKVLMFDGEAHHFNDQPNSVLWTHSHLVELISDYEEFSRIRHSFNKNYIYPVTSIRWRIYKQKQAYYQRPLFYMSDTFCLQRTMLYSLPIRSKLPYRDLFDDFILRVHQSGFYKQWAMENFNDMVRLKLTRMEDPSDIEIFADAIELDDLYWIGWVYFGCIIFCLLGFVGELLTVRIVGLSCKKSFCKKSNEKQTEN